MKTEGMSYDEEQALKHIAPLGEEVSLFSFKRINPTTLEVCFKHRGSGYIGRQNVGVPEYTPTAQDLIDQMKEWVGNDDKTEAWYGRNRLLNACETWLKGMLGNENPQNR